MFNRIPRIKNKNIDNHFSSLEEVVNYIRDESRPEVPTIRKMREIGKKGLGYDKLKNTLPCFIPNFTFDNYVVGKNLSSPTGYLYIDLDNVDNFDFNKTYVAAYWKSVSNRGYGLMVKVDGLTAQNIRPLNIEICKSLSLPFDNRAVSFDRCNALSYDSDAYYNDNVEVFSAEELLQKAPVAYSSSHAQSDYSYFNTNSVKDTTLDCNRSKMRFNNLSEAMANINLLYDENGIMDLKDDKVSYTQAYLPKVIRDGHRGGIMSAFTITMVSLNPQISLTQLLQFVNHQNELRCLPPMDFYRIKKMVEGIYERRQSYKVKDEQKRRFFYTPEKRWEPYEKNVLNCKYIAADKTRKSYARIKKAIEELWQNNVRFQKADVKRHTGMHYDTIAKYYNKALWDFRIELSRKHYLKALKWPYENLGYAFSKNLGMLCALFNTQQQQETQMMTVCPSSRWLYRCIANTKFSQSVNG